MSRVRHCWPPLQEAVHVDHSVQSSHLHSSFSDGQPSSSKPSGSQPRVSCSDMSMQPRPMPWASATTSRLRDCWPRRQEVSPSPTLQSPHSDQLEMWQLAPESRKQSCALHPVVSSNVALQGVPPLAACVMTSRVLVVCPPLQVLVHSVQALHSPTSQLTASTSLSQGPVCSSSPVQPSPPSDADCKMLRERLVCSLLRPLPAVQDDHSDHGANAQSSVGQSPSLQVCLSASSPMQACPPGSARWMMLLMRFWTPPPHVLSQLLQSIQSDISQS
mmetsp:Transcript_64443/g.153777  ORF Transcript_64443/g.153777 Transcript_64443/m.153777 type:complete len:274 (-) Transcript_64443:706-1527(-)